MERKRNLELTSAFPSLTKFLTLKWGTLLRSSVKEEFLKFQCCFLVVKNDDILGGWQLTNADASANFSGEVRWQKPYWLEYCTVLYFVTLLREVPGDAVPIAWPRWQSVLSI